MDRESTAFRGGHRPGVPRGFARVGAPAGLKTRTRGRGRGPAKDVCFIVDVVDDANAGSLESEALAPPAICHFAMGTVRMRRIERLISLLRRRVVPSNGAGERASHVLGRTESPHRSDVSRKWPLAIHRGVIAPSPCLLRSRFRGARRRSGRRAETFHVKHVGPRNCSCLSSELARRDAAPRWRVRCSRAETSHSVVLIVPCFT